MKYTFLFLLIFIFSCTSSQKQETAQATKDLNKMSLEEILEVPVTFSDKEYTLEKIKEINIPIDTLSRNLSYNPIYHDADTAAYYIQGNAAINSIDFYDLDKKELYKRIKFERNGNQMISSTRRLFIKNADSIYIFERDYSRLTLVNIKGDIVKRYSIPKEQVLALEVGMEINFKVENGKAYFKCSPYIDGVEKAGEQKMIAILDLEDGSLQFVPAYSPSYLSTTRENPIIIYNGMLFHDNKYVSIFVITGHIHYGEIGKEEFNQTRIEKKDSQNSKKNFKATSEDEQLPLDYYFQLLYNEEEELYYVVALDGIEVINPITGEPNTPDDRPLTIIIMDKNFHHAGEITLPKKTHYRNVMMARDGLLVSNAHPKNPNNDEEILSFTLYKTKQIK